MALADLLTSLTARQALARRDIAEVFRLLRDAGVSQARIALATGQKRSEISEIIRSGRQVQSIVLLERIADGLEVPRGWMGMAHEPDPAPAQEDSQNDNIGDDNLLRHAATVLRGKPVFGPADPIPVQDAPTPLPRRIGLADISQLAATTDRLGQLGSEFGGIPITGALAAHARAAEALLGATMREPVRKQLLVELSDTHSTAGGAAASAGLRALARQHYVRCMDLAGEAGEMLRVVLALDALGRLELNSGQPNEALKLFQLGAAASPSALARSKLEYDCAWALGLLGEAREAIAALRRADDSYCAASDEPRPWEHFATALAHVEGRTYLALSRFDRATRALSAATDAASHAVACTVNNSGLLATAQLRSGEIGSGLCTAQQVIKLAKGLRSVAILRHAA